MGDSQLWTDKYTPINVEELLVAKPKIQDIDEIFTNAFQETSLSYPRLLILTGPSGCGKHSMINAMAKKHNATVNRFDLTIGRTESSSLVNNFFSFLCSSLNYSPLKMTKITPIPLSSNYISHDYRKARKPLHPKIIRSSQPNDGCLFSQATPIFPTADQTMSYVAENINLTGDELTELNASSRSIVILDSIPVSLNKTDGFLRNFNEFIKKFLDLSPNFLNGEDSSHRSILVFITGDTNQDFQKIRNFFSSESRQHPRTREIHINAFTRRSMQEILENIIVKEGLEVRLSFRKMIIEEIINSCGGDAAKAISQLQITASSGENHLATKQQAIKRKSPGDFALNAETPLTESLILARGGIGEAEEGSRSEYEVARDINHFVFRLLQNKRKPPFPFPSKDRLPCAEGFEEKCFKLYNPPQISNNNLPLDKRSQNVSINMKYLVQPNIKSQLTILPDLTNAIFAGKPIIGPLSRAPVSRERYMPCDCEMNSTASCWPPSPNGSRTVTKDKLDPRQLPTCYMRCEPLLHFNIDALQRTAAISTSWLENRLSENFCRHTSSLGDVAEFTELMTITDLRSLNKVFESQSGWTNEDEITSGEFKRSLLCYAALAVNRSPCKPDRVQQNSSSSNSRSSHLLTFPETRFFETERQVENITSTSQYLLHDLASAVLSRKEEIDRYKAANSGLPAPVRPHSAFYDGALWELCEEIRKGGGHMIWANFFQRKAFMTLYLPYLCMMMAKNRENEQFSDGFLNGFRLRTGVLAEMNLFHKLMNAHSTLISNNRTYVTDSVELKYNFIKFAPLTQGEERDLHAGILNKLSHQRQLTSFPNGRLNSVNSGLKSPLGISSIGFLSFEEVLKTNLLVEEEIKMEEVRDEKLKVCLGDPLKSFKKDTLHHPGSNKGCNQINISQNQLMGDFDDDLEDVKDFELKISF